MQGQQLSRFGHVLNAIAVGEKAVVAEAVEHVETTEPVVRAGYSIVRLRLV